MKKQYVIAIDVGATTCKAGLFRYDERLLKEWIIQTRVQEGGRYIMDDLASSVIDVINGEGLSTEEIAGAGLGIPGLILDEAYVTKTDNAGLENLNVKEELGVRLGLPVYAINDANAAAAGEMWRGVARGYENFVLLTLGTGVGGAVVINGKIINGRHGAAGEIGHMLVNEQEKKQCGCGRHGCLEQYSSTMGLVRFAKEYLSDPNMVTTLRNYPVLDSKIIFEEAKKGDSVAMALCDRFCDTLGRAIANVAVVVDPDLVVLGGGISKCGQFLLESVRNSFLKHSYYGCRGLDLRLAELENRAGMYGCLKLVLDHEEKSSDSNVT